MEFDARKAERVWQRVQGEKREGTSAPRGENLPALIMEQLQLSESYFQMSRRCGSRDAAVYMRLAREAKAQAVCLKGILKLVSEKDAEIRIPPQQIPTEDTALRRWYGQELRLMTEYENRRVDPEYGPVFERMAVRSREHCCALLELIGRMGQ